MDKRAAYINIGTNIDVRGVFLYATAYGFAVVQLSVSVPSHAIVNDENDNKYYQENQ
jgi:hypothetical protein